METKTFEHAIHFHEVQTPAGERVSLPILTVTLVQPGGNRVQLPLLYDTGATFTTLRHDLYSILGLSRWDEGAPEAVTTAGGTAPVTVYRYEATLELLGKIFSNCPVHLAQLPPHPLYMGLLGRAQIFDEFGFGFWEKDRVVYVTETP